MDQEESLYQSLRLPSRSAGKLVLLVLDGVGDIATPQTGYRTPLEVAQTPELDKISKSSVLGRMIPILPGVTVGSGPGHLGLFGYDPINTQVGRGVIEALGVGIELKRSDLAARGNFCSLNTEGVVTDRRAGRISTELNENLCEKLRHVKKIGETEVIIKAASSHRFVVVFRGGEIEGPLTDSDPHHEGTLIKPVQALTGSDKAKVAANIVNQFYKEALPLLDTEQPANGFLLRGFSHLPEIRTFQQRFQLKAAAIASGSIYKGLAQLIGMENIEESPNVEEQFRKYCLEHKHFDYFFIHVKGTDTAGEDGNFDQKVAVIEEVDKALPILFGKMPQVLAITGDHSTPVPMKSHSWHPQPILIHSPVSGSDRLHRFTEIHANRGSLGIFQSQYLIRLMMANAGLYNKFGA